MKEQRSEPRRLLAGKKQSTREPPLSRIYISVQAIRTKTSRKSWTIAKQRIAGWIPTLRESARRLSCCFPERLLAGFKAQPNSARALWAIAACSPRLGHHT